MTGLRESREPTETGLYGSIPVGENERGVAKNYQESCSANVIVQFAGSVTARPRRSTRVPVVRDGIRHLRRRLGQPREGSLVGVKPEPAEERRLDHSAARGENRGVAVVLDDSRQDREQAVPTSWRLSEGTTSVRQVVCDRSSTLVPTTTPATGTSFRLARYAS
ncbi:hypothetical protein D8S78_09410 [Natrialba swarupiae]|nr:hypothetical protein [Natrialba swarupiae]